MFILDLDFFHPGSRIQGSKKQWIPDPGVLMHSTEKRMVSVVGGGKKRIY
jgi:hypothetical protein